MEERAMKTNFRFLALSAAILSMFTACQREELEQNQKPEAVTHSVTFVAGAPETKTTVDISDEKTAKFKWTKADEGRFTAYENGTEALETVGVLDVKTGIMSLVATFDGTRPESASYVAVVNKSNATQTMSSGAYDEIADILVSKAVSSFVGENGVQLQFKREVAIAKMTLKKLDAGEIINKVTVSSNAEIAGSYGVDGWASPAASSIEISSAFAKGVGDYKIVANEAGEAVVWFTCIPQDAATLTVKVEAADGDTYTKEFKPITLTRGDVKAFGVAMTKDVVVKPWVAVDLADIDETMPLVITMATTDKTYALSLTGTDGNTLGTLKAPKAIEVSVVDGKLSEEPSSDILWNIANNNGNLTIYPNGVTNKWLYTTDSNDGVRLGTNTSNGYVWSIDAESGYLKANSTPTKVRYLGVYVTGQDWRAYTNTTGNTAGQTLRFYSNSITEDPTAPKLSVTPTSKTWASVETDAAVFNVTTNTEGEKDWSVSPTTLDWAKIDIDKTAGTITVTPNGAAETVHEAKLTVSHSAGTLSKTITLTQKAASTGGGEIVTLFTEGFGENTDSAREWKDTYKQQGGNSSVYSGSTYTITNAKQSKNTVGKTNSGLAQSTKNTDAIFEIKGLNVAAYSDLSVSYYWKAGSTKETYSTSLYYSKDEGKTYTEVTKTQGTGATTFVEVTYTLPADAVLSNLCLKVVFNTSNTQAVIDEFVLKGTN